MKKDTKIKNSGFLKNVNLPKGFTINYTPNPDPQEEEKVENKSKRLMVRADDVPAELLKVLKKTSNLIEGVTDDETGEVYDAYVLKFSKNMFIVDDEDEMTKLTWDNSLPNAEMVDFQIAYTTSKIEVVQNGKKIMKDIIRVKGIRFNENSEFYTVKEEIFGLSTTAALTEHETLLLSDVN